MRSAITKDDLIDYINLNKDAIKFIVSFIALCTFFYLLYYYFMDRFAFLENITASLLGFLLHILGVSNVVSGNNVIMEGLSLKIIDECTAMFGSIVYVSCVLAYPTDVKKKLTGIALGIPSLYAINMVRLVVLAFVGLWYPEIFDYVHTYLWQTIFIVFVIAIWLIWVDRVVK
ncbi:MAG: archaeosortase B [Euryarchaeota archaeon]|nr:archaeosortase B [Euryarchaeota archaeon]